MFIKIKVEPFKDDEGREDSGDSLCINMDEVLYFGKGHNCVIFYFKYIDSLVVQLPSDDYAQEMVDAICSMLWDNASGTWKIETLNNKLIATVQND